MKQRKVEKMATSTIVARKHFLRFIWDNRMGPALVLTYSNRSVCFALICHRKPERCFKVFGYESPLCSRCTGLGLGLFVLFV